MKALVIVINGLHLGYVGAYGNDWIDTPALDELAATGIVFDQHISDHPTAAGARRSWRTGHYSLPSPDDGSVPSPDVDLVSLLRKQHISTTLIIDGSRPHVADFAAGWDRVKIITPDDDGTPLELTLEAASSALERAAKRDQWLIWIELATLRPPWELPDDFLLRYFQEETDEDEEGEEEALSPLTDPAEGVIDPADDDTFARLQRTYAGAVRYVDTGLGLLLEELERLGLAEDTLLLVTSDHGMPLGEHGVIGLARPWLHDELIHVPLLMRLPGGAEAGRRIAALTQAVDVCPTLLDALGIPLPPTHGQSLLPLIHGRRDSIRPYACAGLQVGDECEWVLRTPEWAFLLPLRSREARSPQLYVKPDDRWEVNDLRQHHLEWTEQLESALRTFVAATRQPGALHVPPLPEETAEQE